MYSLSFAHHSSMSWAHGVSVHLLSEADVLPTSSAESPQYESSVLAVLPLLASWSLPGLSILVMAPPSALAVLVSVFHRHRQQRLCHCPSHVSPDPPEPAVLPSPSLLGHGGLAGWPRKATTKGARTGPAGGGEGASLCRVTR